MTNKEYLSTWLKLRRKQLAPRTLERYAQLVEMAAPIGEMEIDEVTTFDVFPLLDARSETPRTAEQLYVLLHTAYEDARRLGLIDRNPADSLIRPRYEAAERQIWTADECRRYYAAVVTHKHAIGLLLPLVCGLRRGEVCGLTWDNVDIAAGIIHVRQQMVALDRGGTRVTKPKSKAGVRDVPFPAQIRPLLVSRRQIGRVVCITPARLSRVFNAVCDGEQLPHIGLHGLRHTMATAAIKGGGDMRTLQAVLGHANYATTARVYTHPDIIMRRNLIDSAWVI